ncbi:MAG TPA: MoaD/ThiS family protein [Dehalococcoidia bacterium]|nr:MoaD/ThiS family protein [Dehalococcoidia bacterium]
MITLRMTALLAKRARSNAQEVKVDFRPGLRVTDLIAAEGFSGPDAEAITAVVNGETVAQDYELSEGMTVELLVGIAGG